MLNLKQVEQLLVGTDGNIFSVRFRKRTPPHEVREMVCRRGVTKYLADDPQKPGVDFKANRLVSVFDMQKQAYRSIPLEGVIAVKADGEWHQVAQVGDPVEFVGLQWRIAKINDDGTYDVGDGPIVCPNITADKLVPM